MAYPWTAYKTWTTGEVLTAADLNNSFSAVITNSIPANIDDYSTNSTVMGTTTDPYPGAVASLATTLSGELERLRYLIAQITGEASWYVDPATTLTAIKNSTLTIAGAKTFSSDLAITSASTTALNIAAANSGATIGALISNTSNTATSDALLHLLVAGTSANDPYVKFAISGGTVYSAGIDNSDSDKFKISINATLGTSDAFVMTTAGQVTQPLQPCFLAYASSNQDNATGNTNADITVIFGSEVYDIGSNFASNTFTAPVTGKYYLCAQVRVDGLTAAMTSHIFKIKTTARQYDHTMAYLPLATGSVGGAYTYRLEVIADMTAGDTAFVTLNIIDGAGNTADIVGNASVMRTYFCGSLIN